MLKEFRAISSGDSANLVKAVLLAVALLCAGSCSSSHQRSFPPTTARASRADPTSTSTPSTTPPTTAAPGPPYAVGSVTLPLVDTSRPTVSHGHQISSSRSLTTVVWFPDVAGRHPLVVFAHGYQVGPPPYLTLLQAWAAHGYVVAAPEFPLTDAAVAGGEIDENDINNQPEDLRFVTDSLVATGSPVASRIDPAEIALAGHSDGAESAVAASVAPVPPGEPAFHALIAMSVQQLPGVSHTDNPPMLVTQGDEDTINPPAYGYQVYAEGTSPKYLLVLKGGGHLPPVEAGSAWLPGIEAVTEAFLDCYVERDAPAGAIGSSVSGSSLFSFDAG